MKSWHIERRTFLRGLGVSVALPWLEGMSFATDTSTDEAAPPRMCCVFFPFGVPMPPDDHPERLKHGWFPVGEGADFRFTETHRSLEPFRDRLTYFGGLSHPLGRRVPGHKAGDVFLTGADISGSAYRQSVSVDQVAAAHLGEKTRVDSLVLSTSGGVNRPYRSYTLSYTDKGRPVPAEHRPREIFRRLFGEESEGTRRDRRRALENHASILDAIGDEARSLDRRLGRRDREKMDEYLNSVREVERRVQRAEDWLDVPKPRVDPNSISLDAGPEGPRDFLRAMFDLVVFSLQTDTTRVATFQMGSEDNDGVAGNFPSAVGIDKTAHAVSHEREDYAQWSRYDAFLTEQYAYFLDRLRSVEERENTLLDNTMALYGCATSVTHRSRNYPLVLAGGGNLGLQHGQYRTYSEDVPLSNLFTTMLDRMGVPVESFKDSTGDLSELVRARA